MSRITKIYFERLVSHGNYENTRMGMECELMDDDRMSEHLAMLKERVESELAKIVGERQDREQMVETNRNLEQAKFELGQMSEAVNRVRKWSRDNEQLVRMYCAATNTEYPCDPPF